jgi:L-ascorbate metabolism protein UlaG (beta-lactamase superfamily)
MQLTYYGHSSFLLQTGGKNIVFDPFIKNNELASEIDFNSIKADFILVSHGHFDHTEDLIELANQTGATVVCSWEIHAWLNKHGITKTHPMNLGGRWVFDFGTVHMVYAAHSSSLPDGTYGGTAAGFVIESDKKVLYYSGDTALTKDMEILGSRFNINHAVLPIGDNFTMGYQDACVASDWIKCNNIIAMHFDTFGFIKINHREVDEYFKQHNKNLSIPAIGETITL